MATYNAERVVSRYAKEFSTEKAKADYLKSILMLINLNIP